MAIHYRTQGFFLKKEEKGEADFLFTVYTRDFGRLEILGRAIRKIQSKLRAGAREFCLSEIEFIQGKAYKTLTDAILIEEFKDIKRDLGKLKIAYQIAEVLDNLISGQEKDERIWNLLNETFQKLNNYSLLTTHYPLIYYFFLWSLLSFSGYQPQLYNCVLCDKKLEPKNLCWSSEGGGIICEDCFKNDFNLQKINTDIIKILRFLLQKKWQIINRLKISPLHLEQLKTISDNYLLHISGPPTPN